MMTRMIGITRMTRVMRMTWMSSMTMMTRVSRMTTMTRMTKMTRVYQGLSQAAPLRQSHTAIEMSLKKTAKGTICPLQNLGKKLERKHTRRDLFQYTNCKLKQKFYRTFKVHSKVMFQSCSTEHVRLMLNQAW